MDNEALIKELIPYTDFSKPSKEMLIDLINYANRQSMTTLLTSKNTVFTDPVENPKGSDTNTSIRFAKVEGYKLNGDEEIHYNRLNIEQLARVMGFDGTFEIDMKYKHKTVLDILPQLLETFKIYLDENDVEDDNIELNFKDVTEEEIEKYGVNFILRIKPQSIGYYGRLVLTAKPKPIKLETAIQTKVMRGFVYHPTHGLG